MSCQHEGSTHLACDCVLAQLQAADELAGAARQLTLRMENHSAKDAGLVWKDQAKVLDALTAYEKARGK